MVAFRRDWLVPELGHSNGRRVSALWREREMDLYKKARSRMMEEELVCVERIL